MTTVKVVTSQYPHSGYLIMCVNAQNVAVDVVLQLNPPGFLLT
jgi:hypothetical protein